MVKPKIFPRSEHAIQSHHLQIERLKVVHLYLFLCSLSLEETKGAVVTQRLPTLTESRETACTACTATLHFFRRAN